MRCCITGHTKGLGKALYEHFQNKGWEVIGFSRSNGYNISDNFAEIINRALGADLFINNAYADGLQLDLMMLLHDKVKKQIVCGSVASDVPDPTMPEYSKNKRKLEEHFLKLADSNSMLLLKLTSSSYQDVVTVCNTVDFWLNNSSIVSVTFNIED
jgi:nucleoside-diphosphate-sugar epimerase